MNSLVMVLYAVSAGAGWNRMWVWLIVPPVAVFVGLFLQTKKVVERAERIGIDRSETDKLLQDMGARSYLVAAWNGFLCLVIFLIGFGVSTMFDGV